MHSLKRENNYRVLKHVGTLTTPGGGGGGGKTYKSIDWMGSFPDASEKFPLLKVLIGRIVDTPTDMTKGMQNSTIIKSSHEITGFRATQLV